MESKPFKVGDKVCLPLRNLNGEVTRVYNINGKDCITIRHGNSSSSYWADGKERTTDSIPYVYHGHMEEGSARIEFTPKKEPVYEWQWEYVYTNGHTRPYVQVTNFYTSEKEMLGAMEQPWRKDFIRIERSKRERKE